MWSRRRWGEPIRTFCHRSLASEVRSVRESSTFRIRRTVWTLSRGSGAAGSYRALDGDEWTGYDSYGTPAGFGHAR